ncbi:MAG: hypothetical protein IJB11_00650, partial [Oscillospiraceae bacterium]|nr:hypothetical protein [Oscillospiraceae bacterium]
YSQWSKNYVENLSVNSNGKVIAKTYGGSTLDVTNSAEFVIIEDNLGISWSNGKVIVPEKLGGGSASYFFRYRSTTPTGTPYYTVSEVVTVQTPCAHNYTSDVTAPTCTTDGYTTYTCSGCGDTYVDNVIAGPITMKQSVLSPPVLLRATRCTPVRFAVTATHLTPSAPPATTGWMPPASASRPARFVA